MELRNAGYSVFTKLWPKLYKGQAITLEQVLAQAETKYGAWTDTQLEEHRMTHGHCVGSQY
ncbi:MAG: hypothetical protein ACFFFG_03190 [Candidatus Thorarchaeota archaeon]